MPAFDAMNAFSILPWHDSVLMEVRIGYSESQRPMVTLAVSFCNSGDIGGRREVQFNDVRGVYTALDLLAKELCGNQIASGHCEKADETAETFVQRLLRQFDLHRGETMEGLFLFTIELIHPGGTIQIVSPSFSITTEPVLVDSGQSVPIVT